MKIWVFILIGMLLIAVSMYRERFEPTQSIKAPPYNAAEKIRIFGMIRSANQRILMEKAGNAAPNEKDEKKLHEAAGGFVTPAIEVFFTTVFKPATVAITAADVKKFMVTRASDIAPIEEEILTTYFVGQSGATSNSDYAASLAELGQNQGYGISNIPVPNGGDSGSPLNPNTPPMQPPTGGGYGPGGPSDRPTAPSTQALFTGNTTGGSSDTSLGSTSGGGGDRRKQIFGPLFTSRGEGAGSGASSGNSTKDSTYPELLGGGVPKKSTRIDGVGIVDPSKNSDTTGLPSSAGLGSDENSKYFPTSRVPGDMDLIPDPYRVSQTFSASNYSVKNEPVPFLTDFSAFQK